MATFQPIVSTSRMIAHNLSTREKLTPSTYHAKSNHESKYDKIRNHVAPLIMDQIVMPWAQSHKAAPCDIHRYHRGARKKGPENIRRGPRVLEPLSVAEQAKE